jgi:hypothetical protein
MEVEQKIVGTIEEVLYGMEPNTALFSDIQEYEEARQTFERASLLREFSGTPYHYELLRCYEESATLAAKEESSYSGDDDKKAARLRQARINAFFARDFYKGLVDDAVSTLRPIFQKQE